MRELDDSGLLREYVTHGSEEAFATLVTRHINKVYSVALRHTRNPDQAEEITQAVFVILAKKSRHLGRGVILSGWLYQTARQTAMNTLRSEIRRAHREQEACMQTLLDKTESEIWPEIAPLLDTAMAALSELDRHAVVLRFFDGKSIREVGMALGASEDAAKMRLNRAVEKLRMFFTKRGVVHPAEVLTATISAHSVQVAPAGLAATISTTAAKGTAVGANVTSLVKGTLRIMTYAKLKLAICITAGILLAGGAATVALSGGSNDAAANPTGTWKWVAPVNPNGQIPKVTFILKLDGETLTGSRVGSSGTTVLTNGVFKDDEVSFQTPRHETSFPKGKIACNTFSGKLSGDTIKGKTEIFIDDKLFSSQKWVVKRVKE